MSDESDLADAHERILQKATKLRADFDAQAIQLEGALATIRVHEHTIRSVSTQLAKARVALTASRGQTAAAVARERADVLDEVSYRWERRNEVGEPFSEWLWGWVNQAREARAALAPSIPGGAGLEPGQRCTKHGDEMHGAHEYDPSTAARWNLQLSIGRCEFVQPSKGDQP